jgi:hypothetical protein
MRKLLTLFMAALGCTTVYGQAPLYINYQAALRNGSGQPLANQSVTLRLGIYQGAASTLKVFEETHALTTNAQGVVQCQIGKGTPILTATLNDINWSGGIYNLKAEMNSGGGFVDLGSQQMVSVPYALYSSRAGFSDAALTAYELSGSITPSQIAAGGANKEQLLRWNGSSWVPSNDVRYKPGRGISIGTGDSIHSSWTVSGDAMYNNKLSVGIGVLKPESQLDVLQNNFVKAGKDISSTWTRSDMSVSLSSVQNKGSSRGGSVGILGLSKLSLNDDLGIGVYGKAIKGKYAAAMYAENLDSAEYNALGLYVNVQNPHPTGSAYGIYNLTEGSVGPIIAGYQGNTTLTSKQTIGYGIYSGISGGSASAMKYAGYFDGNVEVQGVLSKSSGTFRIDHPQDPENKYLVHSFVESPDMMNVYNGNIVTDADGKAVVLLPGYFETLNREFRYQLTTIGQPAQVWVLEEISENRFVIESDKPNVKVSWQVTGVRKDPWALQHPVVPEEEKRPQDKGKYLNPELYGKPETQGIHYHKPDTGNRQKP